MGWVFVHSEILAQNLVPNPSFESYTGCPTNVNRVSRLSSWSVPRNHGGSPDFFHRCAINTPVHVPVNYAGNEEAFTGDAYAGLFLFFRDFPEHREYLEVRLDSALNAGTVYQVSFKYSLSERSNYSSDDFGVYFSVDRTSRSFTNLRVKRTPQLAVNDILDNKDGWATITMEYTAQGGERYVIFGNFLDDAATSAYPVSSSGVEVCYLYLDDIAIYSDFPCYFELGNDTSLCEGDSLILDATTACATYLWQDGSTASTLSVDTVGTYWAEVTVDGCTMRDTVMVENIFPRPVADLGRDTTLCEGDELVLDATYPNSSYLWQDNTTDPMLRIIASGDYWVELTENGCSSSDTVKVHFNPLPIVDLGDDVLLCDGDTLVLDVEATDGAFAWKDGSSAATFTVVQEGDYWVVATLNNCSASDTIHIDYRSFPIVDLGGELTYCFGDTLILDATTDKATYKWRDNSNTPTYSVSDPGKYWVEVTVNNCSTSDTVTVNEEFCEVILDIPNIFTPNNDGVNDFFVPIESIRIRSMETNIYNRWGNHIFTTNKLMIEWDGQSQSNGTYFWLIHYEDIYGKSNTIKGYIQLSR